MVISYGRKQNLIDTVQRYSYYKVADRMGAKVEWKRKRRSGLP